MVGASGAVMAVVTLYTLFYPRREILVFFLPMPMWALLGIYLSCPLVNGPSQLSLRGPPDRCRLRVLLQAIRPAVVAAGRPQLPEAPA